MKYQTHEINNTTTNTTTTTTTNLYLINEFTGNEKKIVIVKK
jgi:hypothetical protein